jgi:hypothetical protein
VNSLREGWCLLFLSMSLLTDSVTESKHDNSGTPTLVHLTNLYLKRMYCSLFLMYLELRRSERAI